MKFKPGNYLIIGIEYPDGNPIPPVIRKFNSAFEMVKYIAEHYNTYLDVEELIASIDEEKYIAEYEDDSAKWLEDFINSCGDGEDFIEIYSLSETLELTKLM